MSRPLRLDGAIRTSKRKAEARSPQQQRDMIEACAQANGYEILAVHDSGGDESGKTMDRATLRAVMERVHRGETDGLILALTDRLGRAPIEEAMTFVRELGSVGYLVLADAGGRPVDLSDPMAETNLVLQLQMARQYWLATAARFKRSQRDAIKAGKFIGPTPLGYERGEDGVLVEDEVYGPVIRRAYEIAAADGFGAVTAYLEAHGPDRRWDASYVRRLLGSRVYLGESRSGDLVNENAHQALTTLATWTAAQTEPRMRRTSGDYPLSHAVHCGRCGSGMVGQLQTVRDRTYRRMRCANPACKGGTSINADKLEAHVREVMEAAFANFAFRAQFAPEGLEAAEGAWQAASAEVERWVGMPAERRKLLGGARYDAGLDTRLAEEATARATYLEVANRAEQATRLPEAGQPLDTPTLFASGLRALTRAGRIVVAPGRGTIADRVTFDPVERDHEIGMRAA